MLTYEACCDQISLTITLINLRLLVRCIKVTPTEIQEMRNFKKFTLGCLCFVSVDKTLRAIQFHFYSTLNKAGEGTNLFITS